MNTGQHGTALNKGHTMHIHVAAPSRLMPKSKLSTAALAFAITSMLCFRSSSA
jgi:hypothetical protein